MADGSGRYLLHLDTGVLEKGDHVAAAKANFAGQDSPYGDAIHFTVGDTSVTTKEASVLKGDVNRDGHVNLVDFSIMAYWYGKKLTLDFAVIEKERLNGDGVINLTDFSIAAYYWTG